MYFRRRYLNEADTVAAKAQQITQTLNSDTKTPKQETKPTGLSDNDTPVSELETTTAEAKTNAVANTLADAAAKKGGTINDVTTNIHHSLFNLSESSNFASRKLLLESKGEEEEEKKRRAIGMPTQDQYRAILPVNPEVKELTRQAGVNKNTAQGTKSALTHTKNAEAHAAAIGLGTSKKKMDTKTQRVKGKSKERTPGNLDLPGYKEEATILLEFTTRSAGGNVNTLGTKKMSVSDGTHINPARYGEAVRAKVRINDADQNADGRAASHLGNKPDANDNGFKITRKSIVDHHRYPASKAAETNAQVRQQKWQKEQEEEEQGNGEG